LNFKLYLLCASLYLVQKISRDSYAYRQGGRNSRQKKSQECKGSSEVLDANVLTVQLPKQETPVGEVLSSWPHSRQIPRWLENTKLGNFQRFRAVQPVNQRSAQARQQTKAQRKIFEG